ncbi:MAG: glutamate--cysteine ligase [Steroidobacteraceae bacterium]
MPAAVDRAFERRLSSLFNSGEPGILQGGLKGVERESLRVHPDGRIALTPHPEALGSALANEHITTDFSESLIELVTPAFGTSWELLQYLCDLHQFVYRNLDDELLWATSMPCDLASDADIPVARYGSSNTARMKTAYRNGLRNRYGGLMQAISGVHYNYSFPKKLWDAWAAAREWRGPVDSAAISTGYFDLLRNYRRHGWLVLYLFGASPAVGRSFLNDAHADLPALDARTAYEPFGTSLRMSDIGYRNRNQADVSVSVNSLEHYVRDLRHALRTRHPPYEKLGVRVDGDYRQLNANILQIENEYYSYIRPKRVIRPGESPSSALLRAGVEYVEVRALDVSAFDPVGVNQNKLRFMEAFLAQLLLRSSPPIDASEQEALDENHLRVARRGREPGLLLKRDGRDVPMVEWARELLDSMEGLCELLDNGDPKKPYLASLRHQRDKLDDVACTPSARMLKELRSTGESFFDLALRMSSLHKAYFLDLQSSNQDRQKAFVVEAEESVRKQREIEAADREPFEAYLEKYFRAATG